MIAAPLSVALMNHFHSATSVGVAETFVVLGIVYFISMTIGALAIRVPPADWKPAGWTPPEVTQHRLISRNHVHIDQALKTPQFYLIWFVLFLNVTAGIGVLGQASVMIQESFKNTVTASAAAGFVGLLSLFNMTRTIFASALVIALSGGVYAQAGGGAGGGAGGSAGGAGGGAAGGMLLLAACSSLPRAPASDNRPDRTPGTDLRFPPTTASAV